MALIQCDENCKFQRDGFCGLEYFTTVNSINNSCPHFKPPSLDGGNRLGKTLNTDKL